MSCQYVFCYVMGGGHTLVSRVRVVDALCFSCLLVTSPRATLFIRDLGSSSDSRLPLRGGSSVSILDDEVEVVVLPLIKLLRNMFVVAM